MKNCKNHPWIADLGNGFYKNPILYGDYSDPDVIRVGEDFYLISSSFAFIPGIPLLHSKDLVNWELINFVVREIPFPQYDQPNHGCGTWAPSIRYHDGMFYVFVGLPDEGVFMSCTRDPYGTWSPLHCVRPGKGWIDTCPFWDDDGNAYLVHAFANSRCGIKHRLDICRMSPDGKSLLDEGTMVYNGIQDHPTLEGPKLYKRDGWYYILAPGGGVKPGWQVCLRSRNIFGPYEDRIVLHQGNTDVNGPHQGGYVELENGEGWFIHFQDVYEYGRIVHLQPVSWKQGWPFMGQEQNGDGIGEPVSVWKKPNVGKTYPICTPATSDAFDKPELGLQWSFMGNPQSQWYSLTENPGNLRLYAQVNTAEEQRENLLWYAPNLLTQLIQTRSFEATVKILPRFEQPGDKALLAITGHTYGYISLKYEGTQGFYAVQCVRGEVTGREYAGEATETVLRRIMIPASEALWMKVAMAEDGSYEFGFSFDGDEFIDLGYTFQAKAGTWTGAKLAIACLNDENIEGDGCCDFEYIHVE